MQLIDSHCHIHESEFFAPDLQAEAYARAREKDIAMVLVGTSEIGSAEAIEFAAAHDDAWAVIGVHPHETGGGYEKIGELLKSKSSTKVVGVGEIGLDYYYLHTPREKQIAGLEQQLQWALDYDLPVSFHVRDYKDNQKQSVWDDFWPIFDNFSAVRGVLHSFTDTMQNLEAGLGRGLCIGVNGIATFARGREEVYRAIPLEKILLETDAPFLTPVPFRGKMNEPSYLDLVAEYIADLHEISYQKVSAETTKSTRKLFSI